jgi:hypothetical protein
MKKRNNICDTYLILFHERGRRPPRKIELLPTTRLN